MTMEMTPADNQAMEAMANDQEVVETPVETPVESRPEPKVEDKPQERMFPEAAYKREQWERKQAEAKARELEQREAVLRGRLEVLEQLAKGTKEEVPDPQQDIGGHLLHKTSALEKRLQELSEREKKSAEQRERESQETAFLNGYRAHVQAFSQANPDFGEAYNHIHRIRDQELEAMGIVDPTERQNIRHQEERFLVARAQQAGLNPAEQLYKMAKVRGYAKKEQPRDESGKFKAEEKLEQIAKGQAAGKTLGTVEGAGAGPGLTLETLLNMPEDEFSKLDHKTWRKIMGG